MSDKHRKIKILIKIVNSPIPALAIELEEILSNQKTQICTRKWILLRNAYDASGGLEIEGFNEYQLLMRVCLAQLKNIIKKIATTIEKRDTTSRVTISD